MFRGFSYDMKDQGMLSFFLAVATRGATADNMLLQLILVTSKCFRRG